MANWQINPPEKFDFGKPESWPKWYKRFDRFRIASGLAEKDEENQINALVYSMGERADDIFSTFTFVDDDEMEDYDVVVGKFQNYFVKKRNPIFERAKFNQRVQLPGESIDSFVTDLHNLAEHCLYGTLTEELIRDRLVVGLRDAKLSERLQMNPELTLEKAVDQARLNESVKQQQSVLRGNTTQTADSTPEPKVEFIKKKPQKKKKSDSKASKTEEKCSRCGKSPSHPRQDCPAKNSTCHKCRKKGHFKSVCKSVSEVCEESDDDEEEFFFGCINIDELNSQDSCWNIDVKLGKVTVNSKIDTGADVTVVPEHIFEETGCKLMKTKAKLSGANQQKLDVRGVFQTNISYKDKSSLQKVYIVRGLKRALLGRPAIEALNILSFVDAIDMKDDIVKKYPKLFTGLGKLDTPYHIELEKDAKPYAIHAARRISLPLLPRVKKELDRLESLGVISKVEVPTDWCAPIVVVQKAKEQVRICVDLTRLNDSVKRERHILPSVEETLAQLGGAQVFSKLDANSGFHQIPLTEESKLLTTFITPFGRFCYNRLPFGITSAPEHFQMRMSSILSNEEGAVNMIDDTLVFGRNQQEHDERLHKVLQKIEASGTTLNLDKCEFSKSEVKFLGHIVNNNGIRPDPAKVNAIKNMPTPKNIHELRRFLGLVNQLSKFTKELTDVSKPIRDLLSTKNVWNWGPDQQKSFEKLKELLTCDSVVLAHYDPQRNTRVSADASAYGLGAVLEQQQEDMSWRPVVYQSRSMTNCEQRYAQIEKEALGVTWACERFSSYLIGKKFEILTDHKPLVSLLGSKDLDTLPPRIQRFRMRLMRYHYTISHIPGKEHVIADTLSRAPIDDDSLDNNELHEVSQEYVDTVYRNFPASDKQLENIKLHQQEDDICKQLIDYCTIGWPEKSSIKGLLKLYLPVASELTVVNGLLMRGCRVVIPSSLRMDMLDKLHTGHLGIVRCRERARQSVWWPGLARQLQECVENCSVCRQHAQNRAEPLIPSELPELPWQKLASDLLEYKGHMYLVVIDFYSRYVELAKLSSTTSQSIINHLKSIFARHGIPVTMVTDNGPQYSSGVFEEFSREYGFSHITSSPRFAQSNGHVERAVKTVKSLLKKCNDPHLALLTYRSTPLEHGFSPAELLMSRRLRTTVPIVSSQLKPCVPDYRAVKAKDDMIKVRQKRNFDDHHGAREMETLDTGNKVWIPDLKTHGTVTSNPQTRSYVVSTPNGQVRRNRVHLKKLPTEKAGDDLITEVQPFKPETQLLKTFQNVPTNTDSLSTTLNTGENKDLITTTRSGRTVKPPKRFME